MKTRKLGSIEVSPIGMGCMAFSHGYGEAPSEEYAIAAIRKAYEFGCTFYDTAEGYGTQQFYPGHNEQLLGKAVTPFRDKIVIATKFHFAEEAYESDEQIEGIMRAHISKSLENLQTDYIDLYYLHRVSHAIPVEAVARVMGSFICEGLIKGWGLSQVSGETLKRAHEVTPVSAVQNIYSMVERDCEDDIFPYCLQNNIGVVPFSPIASGLLSGKITKETDFSHSDDVRKFVPQLAKENIEANQPLLDLLKDYADQKKATMAQLSLAWMLCKYENCVPIPGSKNQERIIENLGAWNVRLTDEDFNALEKALNSIEVHGHRGHVQHQGGAMSDWGKK